MEQNIFKEARLAAGLTRAAMSELMEIPCGTLGIKGVEGN